jgi:glycerol kinase
LGKYVLALDQGTTSSRAILFNHAGHNVGVASRELNQIYPRPGWVEHDPTEIWRTQLATARDVVGSAGVEPGDIEALGITNQRETTIMWDRSNGCPVGNGIVWQCRRTAGCCEDLKAAGEAKSIQEKTGLVVDAYFSATKIKWILDSAPGLRNRAERGEILFGTVDSWLMWNLTGGRVHATDYSNASRTMLFNIHTLDWDDEILELLNIPRAILPEVRPSTGIFGHVEPGLLGAEIPIAGVAGDQQAALFGQVCFAPGTAKNTYGTGCFMLMNTGQSAVMSRNNLLTTIAWGIDGRVEYALEGSVFIGGAVVQWLRDGLRIIQSAAESEEYAMRVADTGGVYLVPAFVGLGAPHWDPFARGTIVGITRGTEREHIVRAALEAICYQTRDVLEAMTADSGIELSQLKVDGGAVENDFLMQFQSDILGVPVSRPKVVETTALGAACLAGLGVGFWNGQDEMACIWQLDREFTPGMCREDRERLYGGWKRAVERSRKWEQDIAPC